MASSALQSVAEAIDITISRTLSPAARQTRVAAFARDKLAQAEQQNDAVLGYVPTHTTAVDGRQGAALESINPDGGTIVFEFDLINSLLEWIGAELVQRSPVKTGRYARSFRLFADGIEIDPGKPLPAAEEFVFVNITPYARKIEQGESPQAPHGVFLTVADFAQQRFHNQARIYFTYRNVETGEPAPAIPGHNRDSRQPAILVYVKS